MRPLLLCADSDSAQILADVTAGVFRATGLLGAPADQLAALREVVELVRLRDFPAVRLLAVHEAEEDEVRIEQTLRVVQEVSDGRSEVALSDIEGAVPDAVVGDEVTVELQVFSTDSAMDIVQAINRGAQFARGGEASPSSWAASLLAPCFRVRPHMSRAGGRLATKTFDNDSWASDPGAVSLALDLLTELDPEMFEVPWFRALFGSSQMRVRRDYRELLLHLREQLEHGDSRAAVVMSLKPLRVAAYTDEMDCVVLLAFNDDLACRHRLTVGTRLLTVNAYMPDRWGADVRHGPASFRRWVGFRPLIADFLSHDLDQIERRKAQISEAEWSRALADGRRWMAEHGLLARDGRPQLAVYPAGHRPDGYG